MKSRKRTGGLQAPGRGLGEGTGWGGQASRLQWPGVAGLRGRRAGRARAVGLLEVPQHLQKLGQRVLGGFPRAGARRACLRARTQLPALLPAGRAELVEPLPGRGAPCGPPERKGFWEGGADPFNLGGSNRGPGRGPLATCHLPSASLLGSPHLRSGGPAEGTVETKFQPHHSCFRGPWGKGPESPQD